MHKENKMADINQLLDLSDILDQKGLEKEADILDSFLTKAAKTQMHKCGLTEATVQEHQSLLDGYKKALDSYQKEYSKVLRSNEQGSPNAGTLREVLRNLSHNTNAVFLHEMYFTDVINCKPYPLEKDDQAKNLIKEFFPGGANKLEEQIKRVAMTPRNGWVILAFCTQSKSLNLEIIDLHEIGSSICSIPVLALDMWEHAYYRDFGLDKEAYINWFLERLDWRNIRNRIKNLARLK